MIIGTIAIIVPSAFAILYPVVCWVYTITTALITSSSCDYYYYSVVCLTTGPKPLPKRSLHIVRSKASPFKWEYSLLSLRSSSSFLRLLPRLLVTSISPFIFPSITCFRRQFLRKMWPIQLAFRFRISRRIFLCSLTRSNTSSFLTWSIQLIFSIFLQHHISKLSISFTPTSKNFTPVHTTAFLLVFSFQFPYQTPPPRVLHAPPIFVFLAPCAEKYKYVSPHYSKNSPAPCH